MPIKVCVRWFDSYYEEFECTEVRAGNAYLWMRLVNGQNRQIPLHQVRWFSQTPESHSGKTKSGLPSYNKVNLINNSKNETDEFIGQLIDICEDTITNELSDVLGEENAINTVFINGKKYDELAKKILIMMPKKANEELAKSIASYIIEEGIIPEISNYKIPEILDYKSENIDMNPVIDKLINCMRSWHIVE